MGDWKESGGVPRHIAFSELPFQPRFAYGEQAEVAVVTGPEDGTALGSGFARFHRATIPWTVHYDEVLLVLEGEVKIETATGAFALGPQDCAWLPKGTELVYRSESALVFYAIHPSDRAKRPPQPGNSGDNGA